MFKASFKKIAIPLLSLLIGFTLSLVVAALAGESPALVMSVLFNGAFGSRMQFGYALFYATPLIFTGLSVAWAFRAGLFNIGAEGQMTLGGVAMAATGILFPHLPSPVAISLAVVSAFVVGGLWGAIAGWMKAMRGSHEVLATILLNFIAYGIASFVILNVIPNRDSQVPETAEIGAGYILSSLSSVGGTSPLSTALIFALVAATIYAFIFAKTKLGFTQRLVGGAPEVAKRAGVPVDREIVKALFISGGLAGLGGLGLILGFAHKTREGFAAGMGFVGIAVALLGRNTAIGVVLAALLFGVLIKGALDLDLDTEYVTRDLAVVIQAFIVLTVASHKGLVELATRFIPRGKISRV